MAYTFDPVFAVDPNNPANVAKGASITIFDPADASQSPIAITDPTGSPLPNPITVDAAGMGPAYQHPTLARVGWKGAGFTGYFTSYEGMFNETVAAKDAAQESATAAAAAGANAASVASAALAGAVSDAEAAAVSAANAAALVGAPADDAIAAAISGTGATKTALDAKIQDVAKVGFIPSRTFLAAGNSITNGASAAGGQAWVDVLPARVTSRLGGLGGTLKVINAGVGGDRTSDILGRLPGLYATHGVPSVVLVIPSINDRKTGVGLTPAVTMSNVKKQVGMARFAGALPLLTTEPPLNPVKANATDPAFTWASEYDRRAVNVLMRAYAAETKLPFADIDAAFATNDVSDLGDGIHPGTTGHSIIANTIADALAGFAVQVVGTATIRPSLVLNDLFDRADSTTSLGGTWTAGAGTWGIAAGKAYPVTNGTWDFATVDTGNVNHEIIVTGTGPAATAYDVSAVARYSTSGQYLALLEIAANRSAALKLYKVAPGPAPTQLGATVAIPAGTLTDSTVLTLAAVGSALTVRVNGITSMERTDTTYATGTRVGVQKVGGSLSIDSVQTRV